MRSERRLLLLALLAGLLGAHCGGSPEEAPPEPPRKEDLKTTLLEPRAGVRVAEALPGPELRIFEIDLPKDWFVLVVVEQRKADVIVTASGPAGNPIVKIDTPTDDQGVEVLPLVASVAGRHRLTVQRGGESGKGGFELRIEAFRPAQDSDRQHADAARFDAEGEALSGSNPKAAEALYRRAVDAWHEAGDTRGEAITWRRLGLLLRYRRPEEAIRCYEDALRLARSIGDQFQEVRLLSALGLVHKRQEDWSQAELYLRSARAAAQAYRDPLAEGVALEGLAGLAQTREQLARAVELYDEALKILRAHGRPEELSSVLHNVGILCLRLNRLKDAQDHLGEALQLRQDLENRSTEASTLLSLGQAHAWEGERDEALPYFQRAQQLFHKRREPYLEAGALDKLGNLHLESGRLREATAAFRQAANLLGGLKGADNLLGWNLINQGRLEQIQGRPRDALALFLRAQKLLAGDRTGEAAALYSQAAALRVLKDPTGALERVEKAVQILESLRADAPAFSLRSGYLAPRRIYWELWIDLLMEADQPVRALEVSERNRARSFLETLAVSSNEIRRDAPVDLLARDAELTERINNVEQALRKRATAPGRRESLERDLRASLLGYDKLQARLRQAPQRAAPRPLQASKIQETLDEDTLLLVYSLGSSQSFLWAVDRQSIRHYVLPAREKIEAPAHEVWEILSRERRSRGTTRNQALADLGDMLLGPLARDPGVLGTRRLAIVAEGALRALPFAALQVPGAGDPAHPRYLVEDHEIVYLDSPSVLALLRTRFAERPRPPREVAALADPVYSTEDVRRTGEPERGGPPVPEGGFSRLPATRREAEVLASLVPPGQILIARDFAAHRDLFLGGRLRDFRILHVAAHGFLHSRPELSALVLSTVDAKGRQRDGLVRAYELFDLDLPADLVVLSACTTLPDPQVAGEGLMAMPRGFMVAGAPRVVVSLWEVGDDSTADLMELFYRGLFERKLRPAAALREAQIALLRSRKKDPYSWAPFIFQGEWR